MHTLSNKQQGMALAATMLAMLGLMSIVLLGVLAGAGNPGGNGLMSTNASGLQMTAARTQQVAALNVAESGVEFTLCWMHSLSGPPVSTRAFPLPDWNDSPGDPAVTYTLDGGTFSAKIYPDKNNQNAAADGSVLKKYMIEAVGTSKAVGTLAPATQVVRAFVQETSFGKYAYFTDYDPSNLYWTGGRSSFDGPVHTNNSDGGKSNVVWVDNNPIYKYNGDDAFTYSGPGVNWFHNNSYTAQAPASTSDWNSVAVAGAAGVHQSDAVPLPTASTLQQYAAMGQTPPANGGGTPSGVPAATGVTLPPNGGVYVKGDVHTMTLGVDGSGNQTISVSQTDALGPHTTVLTLDTGSNVTRMSTTYTVLGVPVTINTVSSGVTNGVVYVDGNLGDQGTTPSGGLSGTVANNQGLTVVTSASKNLNINGSITYKTPRQRYTSGDTIPAGYSVGDFKPETDPANATFLANAGTLGLVGNDVQIVDNDLNGNPLLNVEVDGSVMAYDTLTACDYATRAAGSFTCMGGQIAKKRGALGQFNSSTLQTVSGLPGKYVYDGRMANTPPPFFPTTSNNYTILSWQRVTTRLP